MNKVCQVLGHMLVAALPARHYPHPVVDISSAVYAQDHKDVSLIQERCNFAVKQKTIRGDCKVHALAEVFRPFVAVVYCSLNYVEVKEGFAAEEVLHEVAPLTGLLKEESMAALATSRGMSSAHTEVACLAKAYLHSLSLQSWGNEDTAL